MFPDKLRELVRGEITTLKEAMLAVKIYAGIVYPIVLGFMVNAYARDQMSALLIAVAVFVTALQGFAIYITAKQSLATEAFESVAEALAKHEYLVAEVERLQTAELNYLTWTVMQRGFLDDNASGSLEDFRTFCDKTSNHILSNLKAVFGILPSECWTFSVYLYDEQEKELIPIWWKRSKNHPSTTVPRTWSHGVGQAGQAFAERRPDWINDAKDFHAEEKSYKTAYDVTSYANMVAIPIGVSAEDNSCHGMLCATSSHAGRLTKSNTLVLRIWASVIGNILMISMFRMDALITQAQKERLSA